MVPALGEVSLVREVQQRHHRGYRSDLGATITVHKQLNVPLLNHTVRKMFVILEPHANHASRCVPWLAMPDLRFSFTPLIDICIHY